MRPQKPLFQFSKHGWTYYGTQGWGFLYLAVICIALCFVAYSIGWGASIVSIGTLAASKFLSPNLLSSNPSDNET